MSKFEKIPDIDELNNFNNYLKKNIFFVFMLNSFIKIAKVQI